jgi:cardiolipin synthase (CMP-forming)
MNIPNSPKPLCLCLVSLLIWAIAQHDYALAFWVFVFAGITDALDGFIARKFNMQTELGAYLDSLADKMLLMSIYITLAFVQALPSWLAILVVSRDVMIMGGIQLSSLMGNPHVIRPHYLSKINTAVQIVFAATVLFGLGFTPQFSWALPALMAVAATTTFLSGFVYLRKFLAHNED